MDASTNTPERDINEGRVLAGHYRIDALLGLGGMGSVYRGVQLSVNRAVAIKLIAGAVANNPECIKRFRREAEAMARLQHPNTVRLFDFGVEAGELFMVMELLEGEDLSVRLERAGALSLREALGIMRQVLAALSEAHALGIVHRDLKPANVFLSKVGDGQVFAKVMDFGIAGIEHDAASTKLTMAGSVLGTPAYMSPEQAQGGSVDARSDLYSLGIMLFEMVTGSTPFSAESVVSLLLAHVSQPPPKLSEIRPDLVRIAKLQQLMDALLAKTPDARPPSASAVLANVESLLRDLSAVARTDDLVALAPTALAAPSQPPVAAAPTPLLTRSRKATRPSNAALALTALSTGVLLYWLWPAPPAAENEGSEDLYTVNIASAPSGARVSLAGVEIGRTPYTLQFRHETSLSVSLPGYETEALKVAPDSEPNVVVELERAPAAAVRVTEVPSKPGSPLPTAAEPAGAASAAGLEEPAVLEESESALPAGADPARPFPRIRRTLDKIFGAAGSLQSSDDRRGALLQRGPAYDNVTSAKRAYRAGQLSEQAYEDTIWVLKTRRANRINAEKQSLRAGSITKDEYKRRVRRIDEDYEGR